MMIRVAAAAVLAATTVAPAFAATVTTSPGSPTSFTAPAGGTTIDFNSPVAAPFTLATSGNAGIVTGSSANNYAQPLFSDNTAYLQVGTGGLATLLDTVSAGYQSVSFFLGSIDAYNTIELLNTTGGVIQSFTGSNFIIPADGDQTDPSTNRRVTITRTGSEAAIGGLRLTSSQNALELDNVVFAVPEPTTWAMMFVGFGMMGASMRYRRRGTKAVYA
jgi:hypothetical protein